MSFTTVNLAGPLAPMAMPSARSSFESRANTLEQNFVVEGFSQEFNGAASHGLGSRSRISIRRDEDSRNPAALLCQPGL